ncbi:hypothetical protein ACFOSC_12295 [Streptantibioticus rubrisoli]|uniref:Uncharacterized protein n=1 Tax=Streptantibioticus rubrisoli TaxID=1387313 RepID=A0ABT1P892_9ACTN|nr:hypothetical protein [Streptantibioticus rubrisoli]MCQ4041590.1 hypothetical protein [Streptantibioticus rubrisoli]
MAINGAADHQNHGCALLLTSAPPGRHRVLDTSSALPLLAAVPPHILTGTRSGGSVVQLVDPVDANTVTTHLHTAAAAPGPLLVYVCGQLTLDRKQRLPHLLLGRTTAETVRYTALPWHWLAATFQQRPPGSTTVVCDLVADESAWQLISTRPDQLTGGLALYGVLAPPPPKRETVACGYSRALAELLRAAEVRPPLERLHQEAAAAAGLTGGRQLLFGGWPPQRSHHGGAPVEPPPAAGALAPAQPQLPAAGPVPPHPADLAPRAADSRSTALAAPPPGAADPHAAIREAARAGRHTEAAAIAAAWEQAALRAAGPSSAEAVHWVEVRADLAMLAQDTGRACELWLTAASARLMGGQDTEDEAVINAVDRAHHCWSRVTDPARARQLAPELARLRRQVVGHQPGALSALQQRLDALGAVR